MISSIAKKIIEETPQGVRDRVRQYGHEVVRQREAEIQAIVLTDSEITHALYVEKSVKWQRARNENLSFKAENEGLKIKITK